MRIGLLTTSFPRTHEDIAGTFVLGFARALLAHGHEIEVLAPEPSEPVSVQHGAGIEMRWVPYLRPRSWQRTFYGAGVPDNVRRDARALLGLVPYPLALARECALRSPAWDALVSHWALPCALVAGAFRRQRPHLAVLHSADVHWLSKLPLRAAIATRVAHGASTLWFVAPEHAETFMGLLPKRERRAAEQKLFVAPMGIDAPQVSAVARAAARRELRLERFTVLTLGRLVPIKAIDVALQALAGEAVTLLVAGDGPERETLTKLAAQHRVDARFLGMLTGAAKAQALAAADAFVMPSRRMPDGRSEGVPIALLEGMSYGLPCVATRTGGIPSVIRHDACGLLVPPDDAHALAHALCSLRDDSALRERLGTAAAIESARHLWPELGAKADAFVGALRPMHSR